MYARQFCPHCNENLSLKTFKSHKRLYFNEDAMEWIKKVPKLDIEGK